MFSSNSLDEVDLDNAMMCEMECDAGILYNLRSPFLSQPDFLIYAKPAVPLMTSKWHNPGLAFGLATGP